MRAGASSALSSGGAVGRRQESPPGRRCGPGWADGASQLLRISPTRGTETNIRHLGGIKATARKRIPHILGFSSPAIPFLWAPSESFLLPV